MQILGSRLIVAIQTGGFSAKFPPPSRPRHGSPPFQNKIRPATSLAKPPRAAHNYETPFPHGEVKEASSRDRSLAERTPSASAAVLDVRGPRRPAAARSAVEAATSMCWFLVFHCARRPLLHLVDGLPVGGGVKCGASGVARLISSRVRSSPWSADSSCPLHALWTLM